MRAGDIRSAEEQGNKRGEMEREKRTQMEESSVKT